MMAPAALFAANNAIRCPPCPLRLLSSQCHSPRRLHLASASGRGAATPASSLSTAWERPTVHSQESLIDHLPRRADGLANVLAIGTANPPKCITQEEYPDWFFWVTQTDHLTHLKAKMKRICTIEDSIYNTTQGRACRLIFLPVATCFRFGCLGQSQGFLQYTVQENRVFAIHHTAGGRTEIKKRYFHYDEDLIRSNPDFLDSTLPSLTARQAITATAVPELAAAAGAKAIAERGRPPSDITHLIFCTYSCTHMPGADLRLAFLLGLSPSVQRTMLNFTGCNSGAAALRLAKDVAENNRGARVLVACAETSLIFFRAPDEARTDTLVFPALFGDGAGAVVVGSDPATTTIAGTDAVEHPIFELVSSAQATIPGSDHVASTTLAECGFVYVLPKGQPSCDWNDLFWVVHPGGRAVLDGIQGSLKLDESKLSASRRVLSEYGNMSGATIIFVLDEMRRRQLKGVDQQQDGSESEMMEKEECEWGAMVGLEPGLTVETLLLRATGN
ncbi:LOW QUALITY PROTEIN: hypothetical protein U9M48_000948 [Paspalum notatum var. saurae]|uniref:chalcone synthase n=1 Tax=Paspalum notatum var. saurae TaxID=547442 RepID=A0AAQ3SGB3_PASNO